jgi:hypothetical protein
VPLDTVGVSHVALSLTCHGHALLVATVTLPVLAAEVNVTVEGDTVKLHDMPCCVTLTEMPAMEICPDRDSVAALAVTENETEALPVPLETAGVIHDRLSVTCHVQLGPVVTATVPVPAGAGSVCDAGVRL